MSDSETTQASNQTSQTKKKQAEPPTELKHWFLSKTRRILSGDFFVSRNPAWQMYITDLKIEISKPSASGTGWLVKCNNGKVYLLESADIDSYFKKDEQAMDDYIKTCLIKAK